MGRGRHNYYCRTSEQYRRSHAPELLEKLKRVRREVTTQRAPIGSPDYRALTTIKDAIDDFAEVVTGDRELFWDKAPGIKVGAPDRS
jgi:hypothetical protein